MSEEELIKIAFAKDKTVADILRHIFNLGVEKGRADAFDKVLLPNKEYCWQVCDNWEMCNRCLRLNNGDTDYFEAFEDYITCEYTLNEQIKEQKNEQDCRYIKE